MRIRPRTEEEFQGLRPIADDMNVIREVVAACKANFTSFGLSSTSRISTMFSIMRNVSPEGQEKCCPVVDGSLDPDAPTMAMDDALHNRQAHPCPFVLFGAV
jgi:hypothetical protein